MVDIKNKRLVNYLQVILNKNIESISLTDLEKVKVVSFIGDANEDNYYKIDISDINMFKNIEEVTISDSLVSLENIKTIFENNIKKLTLYSCAIDDDNSLSLLTNIKYLNLSNSFIEKYDFLNKMNDLESLTIINPQASNKIDISLLKNMKNLSKLILEKCDITNFDELANLNKVEYLDLILSVISCDVVPIFNDMKSLSDLFITDIHNLDGLKKNINVRNSLIEYAFDKEESKLII